MSLEFPRSTVTTALCSSLRWSSKWLTAHARLRTPPCAPTCRTNFTHVLLIKHCIIRQRPSPGFRTSRVRVDVRFLQTQAPQSCQSDTVQLSGHSLSSLHVQAGNRGKLRSRFISHVVEACALQLHHPCRRQQDSARKLA